MLPTHRGSMCHITSKHCSPACPLLPTAVWPRSTCQIHFEREFHIWVKTCSLNWLGRDHPFPKMLEQSQASGGTLFPHSRAQGQRMLNAAPGLPTSSLSLNVESVQLKDEAQKKMGTFFFPLKILS